MGLSPRTLRPANNFTPRSITGLALWLDASDASTLFQDAAATTPATATSDPVGAWLDKSGNARHATQSTAGSRPKASTAGMNGGRSVQFFGGASEALSLGDLSSVFSSAGEIIVAYEPLSDSSYGLYETRANSSYFRNANGLSYFGTLAFGRQSGIAVSMPTSGRHVASMRCSSGGQQVVRLDGAQVFTGSPVSGYTAGTSHVLGNNNNPAADSGLTGYITDVLAFPRILTDAERTRIEKWLAARRGITLAPTASNADAQDWINRVYANGGTVSASTAAAVSTFCDAIDSVTGLRACFSRLNLFCGSNLNAALVPLYRSASFGGSPLGNATDTNNAFVGIGTDYAETGASGGLTGNGTTKYLNTGFNVDQLPGAANCHLSSFITGTQDIASARTLIGVLFNGTSDRYRLFLQLAGSSAPNYGIQTELGKANIAIANNRTNTNGGLILASRTSTTLLTLYDDAVSIGTSEVSTAETTGASPFFVFARNGPTEYYNGRMAAYSIGAGMTAAQVTAYNTAIQAFQATMGRV